MLLVWSGNQISVRMLLATPLGVSTAPNEADTTEWKCFLRLMLNGAAS